MVLLALITATTFGIAVPIGQGNGQNDGLEVSFSLCHDGIDNGGDNGGNGTSTATSTSSGGNNNSGGGGGGGSGGSTGGSLAAIGGFTPLPGFGLPLLGSVLGASTDNGMEGSELSCSMTFTQYMRLGMQNSPTEVSRLQTILNRRGTSIRQPCIH